MPSRIPPQTKLVVFDYDDTLVGTRKNIWELHKFIARTFYKIELSEEEILKHWGKPIAELARQLYKTDDIPTATALIVEHTVRYPKQKFPDTNTTLRYLRSSGLLTGIVSATLRPIFLSDCHHVKLPVRFVDYLQTSEDTAFHKPDRRVFEPLLRWGKERGIKPTEILYVGDGLQDMRAAKDSGFEFLGVTTGLVTSEVFASHGARSIARLKELIG